MSITKLTWASLALNFMFPLAAMAGPPDFVAGTTPGMPFEAFDTILKSAGFAQIDAKGSLKNSNADVVGAEGHAGVFSYVHPEDHRIVLVEGRADAQQMIAYRIAGIFPVTDDYESGPYKDIVERYYSGSNCKFGTIGSEFHFDNNWDQLKLENCDLQSAGLMNAPSAPAAEYFSQPRDWRLTVSLAAVDDDDGKQLLFTIQDNLEAARITNPRLTWDIKNVASAQLKAQENPAPSIAPVSPNTDIVQKGPGVMYGILPGDTFPQAREKLKMAGFDVEFDDTQKIVIGQGWKSEYLSVPINGRSKMVPAIWKVGFVSYFPNSTTVRDFVTLSIANYSENRDTAPIFQIEFARSFPGDGWPVSETLEWVEDRFGGKGPCNSYIYYYDDTWKPNDVPVVGNKGACQINPKVHGLISLANSLKDQLSLPDAGKLRVNVTRSGSGSRITNHLKIMTSNLPLLLDEMDKSYAYWIERETPKTKSEGMSDF